MWKDFFNFSKRERITIIALTFLILMVQVLIWTKDSWVKFLPEEMEHKYQQKKELEAYRDSVTAQKPVYATQQRSYEKKTPVRLIPFNPNTADSMTFRSLGLRSYVVKNILNYRRKGGQFRKPSDFARIYGLEPDVFAKLEKFIQMDVPSNSETVKGQGALPSNSVTTEKPVEPAAEKVIDLQPSVPANFDLNTADTSMLQQLKGIGSYTANRIARYRNQLGGYYSMTQLSEIKGLYPETLARLQSMLKIDPSRINTLNVNKASLEKLRAHPYLNFYQAKVIVELRRAKGNLHSLDELAAFGEFKPEDLGRLKWYLSF